LVKDRGRAQLRKLISIKIGPDLVVTTLTAPATAGAGQSITVGDTKRNQGGGGGAGASATNYHLSTYLFAKADAAGAIDAPALSRA
jgi:hypothetical protein